MAAWAALAWGCTYVHAEGRGDDGAVELISRTTLSGATRCSAVITVSLINLGRVRRWALVVTGAKMVMSNVRIMLATMY
jgi:hypothetical protein